MQLKHRSIWVYILLMSLQLLYPISGFSQRIIFTEDFLNNKNNWEVDADAKESSFIQNGKYYIKVFDDSNWHWFTKEINLNFDQDYLIETTINIEKITNDDSYFGLLWGTKDVNNMLQFVIYPKENHYSGMFIEDGSYYRLFPTFNANSNNLIKFKITILKARKKIYYLINDNPVGKSESYALFGNNVGFVVSPKTEISADYITVNEISLDNQIIKNIISKFPTTEEREYYYNENGFLQDSSGENIIKENSVTYRVFTENDNEEIIGYVKEYDSKSNKLLKKFQVKSLDQVSKVFDVLVGEEIIYDEEGNVQNKIIYYNENNEDWLNFGNHFDADVYSFNRDGWIENYIEYRDKESKKVIKFNSSGEIESADNIKDKFIFEKNAFDLYDKVYRENFDIPALFDWKEFDIKTSISKLTNKGYYLKSKENSAARSVDLDINYNKNDFSISLLVEKESQNIDGFAAIALGFDEDALNGISFAITSDGQYGIFQWYSGIRTDLVNFKNPPNPKTSINAIDIVKIGKSIYFSLNGTKVYSMDYFPLVKQKIGLQVHGNGYAVSFSHMILKELNIELPESFSKFSPKAKTSDGFISSGSGFFLSTNGYIITNNHVIANAKEIYIDVNTGTETKTYKATLVKTDVQNDLAVLRLNIPLSPKLPPIPYAINTKTIDVGRSVFTLGFPYALSYLGKEIKFSDGKISSKSGYENDMNTYQITIPVQPGNSGGPMFDTKGNLVGIINAKFTAGDNISYSIKSSILKAFLDSNSLPQLTTTQSANEVPLVNLIKTLERYVVLIKIK